MSTRMTCGRCNESFPCTYRIDVFDLLPAERPAGDKTRYLPVCDGCYERFWSDRRRTINNQLDCYALSYLKRLGRRGKKKAPY